MAIESFIIDHNGRAGEGRDPWFIVPDHDAFRLWASSDSRGNTYKNIRYKLTDNLARYLVEWLGDVVDAS